MLGCSAILGTLANLARLDMMLDVKFHVGPPNALGEKGISFSSAKVASNGTAMCLVQQQLAASMGDYQLPMIRVWTAVQQI